MWMKPDRDKKGEEDGLLVGRKQVDSGWFDLCLSEHDSKRLNDKGAQSEDKRWNREVFVKQLTFTLSHTPSEAYSSWSAV